MNGLVIAIIAILVGVSTGACTTQAPEDNTVASSEATPGKDLSHFRLSKSSRERQSFDGISGTWGAIGDTVWFTYSLTNLGEQHEIVTPFSASASTLSCSITESGGYDDVISPTDAKKPVKFGLRKDDSLVCQATKNITKTDLLHHSVTNVINFDVEHGRERTSSNTHSLKTTS